MVVHARRKAKGSAFERELVHLFWKNGWGSTRIAGSGSIHQPAPDLIAGRPGRFLAIEAKTSSNAAKYLTIEEVDDLISFATAIGAEPWIAVKFKGNGIWFCAASSANRTERSVIVSLGNPSLFTFSELINEQ